MQVSTARTYFISDAHLGVGDAQAEIRKKRHLLSFFDLVQREGASLYILGDLFDFFFDRWRIIPHEYEDVVSRLKELVQSGVSVHYLVGNHDYWLGEFWKEETGISVYRKPLERKIQGMKLFLAHGDGMGHFDLDYEIVRLVLRSPLNIRLYSLLGPHLGFSLARRVSRTGRRRCVKAETARVNQLWNFARRKFGEGFDAVICGHIHKPACFRESEKVFLLLGDWMENFSYGRLENGNLSLEYFTLSSQASNDNVEHPVATAAVNSR